MSINQTRMHPFLWSYGLRGSVTLIIENVTVEHFETIIYRPLRKVIAGIVRKYCSIDQIRCLSDDAQSIR